MGSILYYSNFCDHSKKLLQHVSKIPTDNIHFISIDKRVREPDGKVYILLENGQKIIMPQNIDKVPAMLLLNGQYNVLYGEDIYNYIRPAEKESVRVATNNNMEPIAYCLGNNSSYGGIISDNFSFLDMDSESLKAKGDGGLRQPHNYFCLNHEDNHHNIYTPTEDISPRQSKLSENVTIEQLQQQRDKDVSMMNQQPRPIM
jgi:hypothetical protein